MIILNNGEVIADNDTDALVDLFETQAYRVVLDAPVPGSVRARLEREFGATCRTDGNRVTVEWFDTDSATMYAVMNLLAETGQELRDVESVDPDLEEVFLRLVDGADTATGTGADTAELGDGTDIRRSSEPATRHTGNGQTPEEDDTEAVTTATSTAGSSGGER